MVWAYRPMIPVSPVFGRGENEYFHLSPDGVQRSLTMFRKTSADGKVDEQPSGNQTRLSDFDIERRPLKTHHLAFFTNHIQPIKAIPTKPKAVNPKTTS